MGFFDFLRPKKKLPKAKIEVTASEPTKEELDRQYKEYYQQQRQEQMRTQAEAAIKRYSELHNPILKDDAGLLPTEILMLSYYQKYSKGTNVAKFWYYDYGITDVWPIIRKLESMGFAENGKLTEKGKEEIKNNEYVYFWHRKAYARAASSLPEFCRAVNARRDIPYRDLIWGKYNKLYLEAISSPKKCRDLRYSMYEFLVDEKKFKTAFSMLLEIPFYDMNCQYPFIAPGIMQGLKKAQKKAGFTEDQIFDMAKERYSRMLVENPTVPAIDAAGIVTSYIFGKDGIAQRVLKSYKIDCNRLFSK